MRKKKLRQAINQQKLEIERHQSMLNTRIQLVGQTMTGSETLLMNMTIEAFLLAKRYGGYTDTVPEQWIFGPVQLRVYPVDSGQLGW